MQSGMSTTKPEARSKKEETDARGAGGTGYHRAKEPFQPEASGSSSIGRSSKRDLIPLEDSESTRELSAAELLTTKDNVIVGPSSLVKEASSQSTTKPSADASTSSASKGKGPQTENESGNSSKKATSSSLPESVRAQMKEILEMLGLEPTDEVAFRKNPEVVPVQMDGKEKEKERAIGITKKEVVAAMHYMHFSKRIEDKIDSELIMKLFQDSDGSSKKATAEFGRVRPRGVYGVSKSYWKDKNLLEDGDVTIEGRPWESGKKLIKNYSREKIFRSRSWIINTVKTSEQRPENLGRWFYFFDTEKFLKLELFEFEPAVPADGRQLARSYSRYVGKRDEKLAVCFLYPGVCPLVLQPEKHFRLAIHIPTEDAVRMLYRIRRDSPDWQDEFDVNSWFKETMKKRDKQTRITIGEPVPEVDLQMDIYDTVSTAEKTKQVILGSLKYATGGLFGGRFSKFGKRFGA